MKKQTRRRPCEDIRSLDLTPIPEMNGYYITSDGRVFSIMQLTPYEDDDGYARVHIFKNGKHKRPGVHVLLAKTFLPPPRQEHVLVRHLDGDKKNMSLDNLAWGTQKENGEDKSRHGTLRGEKNPKAKLCEEDVLSIKQRLKEERIVDVAKDYPSIGRSTIDAIKSGKNWSHL